MQEILKNILLAVASLTLVLISVFLIFTLVVVVRVFRKLGEVADSIKERKEKLEWRARAFRGNLAKNFLDALAFAEMVFYALKKKWRKWKDEDNEDY